jgi:hypothetical protein
VAAHVREDQLAVVVNVVAVAAGMSVEVEAEIEDRSRVPIQRTAKASFFIECVPQKQKGCDRSTIEDRSLFCVLSHSLGPSQELETGS